MKRFISVAFLVIVMTSISAVPVMAADNAADSIIYYEDGSYAVVTLSNDNFARANIDKEKVYTYYNLQGQRCFAYTLRASFTYNGVTSQADSCKGGVVIYREGWTLSTHSEYVSGNTAYGRATFTGPNGESRTASLTLTCDKNGNVT